MDNFDLTKKGDKWSLKKQGNDRASKTFDGNKQDAIRGSAEHVKGAGGGSLKIHKEDGKYQEERTYPRSKDPRSSKG